MKEEGGASNPGLLIHTRHEMETLDIICKHKFVWAVHKGNLCNLNIKKYKRVLVISSLVSLSFIVYWQFHRGSRVDPSVFPDFV